MLKFPAVTVSDQVEAAKLRRRQQYEEKRRERIFNARQRCFGLDLNGLEQQIKLKKQLKDNSDECERRFQAQTQMQQHAVFAKSLEEVKHKMISNADLNAYRCRFQRPEQRREYDLNDPDVIRKSKPARIADHDIRLGISSAQVFQGEDLHNCERRMRQRMQQKAWLDQQIKERHQAEAMHKKAQETLVNSMQSRDKHLDNMAQAEQHIRDVITMKTRDYNFRMAVAKREKEQKEKKEKLEDDMAEIYNMMTSDMLTENPDVAQSKVNPKKKIAFMYRGMTPEEMQKFRYEQNQQLTGIRKRKTQVELMDKQWEQYTLNLDRELVLQQLQLDRTRKQELDRQIETNTRLANEQRERRESERIERQNNRIANAFYDQFNTTTR